MLRRKEEEKEEEEDDQVICLRGNFFCQLSLTSGHGWLVTSSNRLASTVSVFYHCQIFGAVQSVTFCKMMIFRELWRWSGSFVHFTLIKHICGCTGAAPTLYRRRARCQQHAVDCSRMPHNPSSKVHVQVSLLRFLSLLVFHLWVKLLRGVTTSTEWQAGYKHAKRIYIELNQDPTLLKQRKDNGCISNKH